MASTSASRLAPLFVSPEAGESSEALFAFYLDEPHARSLLKLLDGLDDFAPGGETGASLMFTLERFGRYLSEEEVEKLEGVLGEARLEKLRSDSAVSEIVNAPSLGVETHSLRQGRPSTFLCSERAYVTRAPDGTPCLAAMHFFHGSDEVEGRSSHQVLTQGLVLLALLRTVRDDEIPSLLLRLAEVDPGLLLTALSEPLTFPGEPEGEGRDLTSFCTPEIWTALLSSADHTVRQQAMLLSARASQEDGRNAQEPPLRPPRR